MSRSPGTVDDRPWYERLSGDQREDLVRILRVALAALLAVVVAGAIVATWLGWWTVAALTSWGFSVVVLVAMTWFYLRVLGVV